MASLAQFMKRTKKRMNDFKEVENKLRVTFNDKSLLEKALIHRSYINENRDKKLENNERLEFLGDAVLELIISSFLFNKYDKQEGELTAIRSAVVRTESLAAESRNLGIGQYLLMSKGEEESGGKDKDYLLANMYEAVLGAIYLDLGYEEAKSFVERSLLQKVEDIVQKESFVDPKTKVQEIIQFQYKVTPTYEVVEEKGPDHDKSFTVILKVSSHEFAKGEGPSKQKAEEAAARDAIIKLEKKKSLN